MHNRVKLIDVDSKIPNLALMKISAYHHLKGDVVGFNTESPNIVYISVIFEKNREVAAKIARSFSKDVKVIIGGSGFDLATKLPDEIEMLKPDYTLYPECDYSLGFSTRGCIRHCNFCIVPIKEGIFRTAQHPSEWYESAFCKIAFLDNNILANKKWFLDIAEWCLSKNLQVQFMQGLDIRLVDPEIAQAVKKLKFFKPLNFAWDNIKDEEKILKGIEILKEAGISKSRFRGYIQFFVYVDNDSDEEYESALYRCRRLKELGTNPFVMYNVRNPKSQRIQDLRRWANRKQLFWSCDIVEYNRGEIAHA